MKPVLDLSLDVLSKDEPLARLMKHILLQALHDVATEVVFQIGPPPPFIPEPEDSEDRFLTSYPEGVSPPRRRPPDPDVEHMRIFYVGKHGLYETAPPPRYLYEPCLNWLFNFTRHPFWKRGPVRSEIWIENPHVTFLVTAEDWHRKVTLTRVEHRLEPAGEPGDDDALLPPAPAEPEARWVFRARDLPELQEVESSQRAQCWRAFCHSRRMLPRTIGRAMGGAGLVSFVFLVTVSIVQQHELRSERWLLITLLAGLLAAGLAVALHQALHFHSLRPSLREWLQSRSTRTRA